MVVHDVEEAVTSPIAILKPAGDLRVLLLISVLDFDVSSESTYPDQVVASDLTIASESNKSVSITEVEDSLGWLC